jgi:hypothetical protein
LKDGVELEETGDSRQK